MFFFLNIIYFPSLLNRVPFNISCIVFEIYQMMHLYCDFWKSLPLSVRYHSSLLSVYLFLENFLLLICCRFRNQALDCQNDMWIKSKWALSKKDLWVRHMNSKEAMRQLLPHSWPWLWTQETWGQSLWSSPRPPRGLVWSYHPPSPTPASPCRIPGVLQQPPGWTSHLPTVPGQSTPQYTSSHFPEGKSDHLPSLLETFSCLCRV